MLNQIKSTLKRKLKRALNTWREKRAFNGYWSEKTRQYLAIHKQLKSLPQDHKNRVIEYWAPYLSIEGGGDTTRKHTNQSPNLTNKLLARCQHTLDWHTIIYNVNQHHPLDVRYLDNFFYYRYIIPYFNPPMYNHVLGDKNYYDAIFHNFNKPTTILRKVKSQLFTPKANQNIPITINQAIDLILSHKQAIIKPTMINQTGSGKDINLLSADMSREEIATIIKSYNSDFIVQDLIKQHQWLANLNSHSVNTFRIMTLFYKEKFHYLGATLLVGEEGLTSNGGHFRIGIDENGDLRNFIIKGKGEHIEKLPNAIEPYSKAVPHIDDIKNMALEMHSCIPHIGLIGWDFTLDKNGIPLFIELNSDCPGVEILELCNKTLFGEMTDEILDDVYEYYTSWSKLR